MRLVWNDVISAHKKNRLAYSILLILIVALILHFGRFLNDVATRPSHSFVNYYTASRLLTQGVEVSQYYDDTWYMQQTAQITPGIEDIYMPHFPTTALMLLPISHLQYAHARVLWTIFNLLAVMGGIIWLFREEKIGGWRLLGILLYTLLYQPLYANFEFGQVYGLLFGGMAVIWYSYKYQHDRLLGITLGLIVIFKTAGLLLFLLLILKKRWRALKWSVLTAAMISLVSLLLVGIESWRIWLNILPEYSARPSFAVTAYQSLPGFFKHIFFYHPQWNPTPLFDAPALASGLSLLVVASIVGISSWYAVKSNQAPFVFIAFLIANTMISPATLDYHYMALLFPILLLVMQVKDWSWRAILVLVIGLFLIAVDTPYQSQPSILLSYPKLTGILLLWGLVIWQGWRKNENPLQ